MSSNIYQEFAASEPAHKPTTARVRDSDPNEHIEVSVYLKPRGLTANASGATVTRETREDMHARRTQEHQDDIRLLHEFAAEKGLTVTAVEPARRLVKISGSVSSIQSAFGTSIGVYRDGTEEFRSHSGALQLPQDVLPMVESVLGIDNREFAEPHFVANLSPAVVTGHWPNAIAALYGFPTGQTGAGQCIGIIELGGGYKAADTAAAFAAMGLPTPTVVPVSVDGAVNNPGSPADGEVALDIQVAGGAAPGARMAVYFAPNTLQGFVDAVTAAAQDAINHPSVISISWGTAEDNWGLPAMQTMNTALQDAATLGISVFVASGDHLGTDNLANGKANVDFPAASPWAIGCGGTILDTNGNSINSEVVWNDGADGWGTGGGISDFFPLPAFQAAANLPASVNDGGHRRGVPDVAADAAQSSGYRIILNGSQVLIGGTSAVAPLWAGLSALINQATAPSIGFFLPTLYSRPSFVRVITQGNNKPVGSNLGYDAGPGWSACTGLGVPIGNALLVGLGFPARANSKMAAVQWMNGSNVELRVYYQDTTNNIREYCYTGNQWLPGASFGPAAPGSALAAVQWMSGSNVELRVYYQTVGNALQEQCYTGNQWVAGAALGPAAPGTALAAVQWMNGSNVELRVYYQTAGNALQEQCYTGNQWVAGAALGPAAPGTALTGIQWMNGSNVELRVYYRTTGSALQDQCYTGNQWVAGAFYVPTKP